MSQQEEFRRCLFVAKSCKERHQEKVYSRTNIVNRFAIPDGAILCEFALGTIFFPQFFSLDCHEYLARFYRSTLGNLPAKGLSNIT